MAPPFNPTRHWWSSNASRRKPPPLTMIPITLACMTTFLMLMYISDTSRTSLHHNSATPTLDHTQHNFIDASSSSSAIISVENGSPSKVNSDVGKRGDLESSRDEHDDYLLSDDIAHLPLQTTTFPSLKLDGTLDDDQNKYDDEVYHDKEFFLQNYEEMKRSLKIYIYPHKKKDPFAGSLLPVDEKHEPGGNYASEAYFKQVLYKSSFITNNPSNADLFFLPFSIASLRHDRRVGVGGLKDFIRDYMLNITQNYQYWNRTSGADHFYVACHSVGRMAMQKVDYVKSNVIQVICSSSYFLPNYFTHKDVSLPQIWPRHEEPSNLGLSERKKLAFFAGAGNSPVRKAVVQAWGNDSTIFVHSGRLKTPYSEQMLGSKYCLHVKGFEVNTARIGDAIYYGCVPVILADYYDLPFMDILNWKTFSVVVTTYDIPNLKKILQSITPEEYAVLQANVLQVRKHFQWNRSPLQYDTFHMVMYELWRRRSSIRLFS